MNYSAEYLAIKSSKLKSAGWVLCSLGTVLGVSGLIVYEKNLHSTYSLNQLGDALLNTAGAEILMIAGSTMVLISIPVFISSGQYKKKALNMSASLKLVPSQELSQTGMSLKHYPAVGISIRL